MYSDNLVQNPFYEPYIIWFQQLKAKEKISIYWDKIIFVSLHGKITVLKMLIELKENTDN